MSVRTAGPATFKAWEKMIEQQIAALQRGDNFSGTVSVGRLQIGDIYLDSIVDAEVAKQFDTAGTGILLTDKNTGAQCFIPVPCPTVDDVHNVTPIPPMAVGLLVTNTNLPGLLTVPNSTSHTVPYDVTLFATDPWASITSLIVGPITETFMPAFPQVASDGYDSPGTGAIHCSAGVTFTGTIGGGGYIKMSIHALAQSLYDRVVAETVIPVPSSPIPISMNCTVDVYQSSPFAGFYVDIFQTTGSSITIAADNRSFISAFMEAPTAHQVNGYF